MKAEDNERFRKGELVKKTFSLVCFFVLLNATVFAQSPRIVHIKKKSAIHVAPQAVPAGLKVIYSSLGPTKTDLYNDATGWAISIDETVAVPFTSKSNFEVSEVQVPIKYLGGTNQANVSIYGGSGDVPDTLLAGPVTVTDFPDTGTCCTLAVANFPPLAVSAGTQYWVVVGTPPSGTGSDFEGVWDSVAKIIPVAYIFQNNGWEGGSADDLPACEVLGTST